jgi:hypothetical protein
METTQKHKQLTAAKPNLPHDMHNMVIFGALLFAANRQQPFYGVEGEI